MNDSCETASVACSGSKCESGRQVIAILAAAVVLGLIYNIASPLGVRAPKPEARAVAGVSTATNLGPVHPALPTPTNAATSVATQVPPTPTNSVSALTWAQVKPLLAAGEILLVDARLATTYEAGHIPGAVSLPENGSPADFLAFVAKHPKDTAIVVHCSGPDCDMSHVVAGRLAKEFGFTNVREMPGGFDEYRIAESAANPTGSK